MRVNRRRLLALTVTAAVAGLAGCSGDDNEANGGDDEETPTPDETNGGSGSDSDTGSGDDGDNGTDPEEPREITGNDFFEVEYNITPYRPCDLRSERSVFKTENNGETILYSTGVNGTDCDELRIVNGELGRDGLSFIVDAEILPSDDGGECDEDCTQGYRVELIITFLQEVPTGFEFYVTKEDRREVHDFEII